MTLPDERGHPLLFRESAKRSRLVAPLTYGSAYGGAPGMLRSDFRMCHRHQPRLGGCDAKALFLEAVDRHGAIVTDKDGNPVYSNTTIMGADQCYIKAVEIYIVKLSDEVDDDEEDEEEEEEE